MCLIMMITLVFGNHKVTYPVRAAEHVKYEYFILDMVIHGDTLAIYNIFDFYNNYNWA